MGAIIEFPIDENSGMGAKKFFATIGRFSTLRSLGRHGRTKHGRPGRGRRRIFRPGPSEFLSRRFVSARNFVEVLDRNIANVERVLAKLRAKTQTPGRTNAITLLVRRLAFLKAGRAGVTPTELPAPITPVAIAPSPGPVPAPQPEPQPQPAPIQQERRRVISTQPSGKGFSGIKTDPSNLPTEIINGITYPLWGDFARASINKQVYLDGYNSVPAASTAIADSQSFKYGRLDVQNGLPAFTDTSKVTPKEKEVAKKAAQNIVLPDPARAGIFQLAGEGAGGAFTNFFGGITRSVSNALAPAIGAGGAQAVGAIAPFAILGFGAFMLFGRRRR